MLRGCCHRVWTRLCDLRRGLWAPAKNGRRSVVSCIDRKTRPGVKGPSTWPALAALGPRVSPLERPSRLPVPDLARPGGGSGVLLTQPPWGERDGGHLAAPQVFVVNAGS